MNLPNDLADRRRLRGWTQEELAEHSGLSVRTIRNVELGLVRKPRRSSVELIAQALGGIRLATPPPRFPARADRPEPTAWRGTQPPNTPLVGDRAVRAELADTVLAHRLTTFLGPGGVGKTRLALEVAVELCAAFRDGVVVVELGDVPSERRAGAPQAAAIQRRIRRQLDWPVPSRADPAQSGSPGPAPPDQGTTIARPDAVLLVLDNAEHVPAGAIRIARDLLAENPGMHILVTARRPVTERLGVNREIRPLELEPTGRDPARPAPAVELVLRHVGADSPVGLGLARDLSAVAELCRRLDGVPRYLEFAAERLRTVPIRHLLAGGPALEMLFTNDHGLLRHQRSVADGIGWNLDLLTEDHSSLLHRLVARGDRRFQVDDVVAACAGLDLAAGVTPLTLLSELLETTLAVADPSALYHYRLAGYVPEFVRSRP